MPATHSSRVASQSVPPVVLGRWPERVRSCRESSAHTDSERLHTVTDLGVQTGERVSTLYRKFGTAIFSRCRRLLKDDALAEDATQEVFVRVLRHIESAPDDATALAWIYRISTNYCLNQIRDRSRQAEPTAPEELPEGDGVTSEPELLDRDVAMRLIKRAPDKLQEVAVLYYMDGLEQEQIASTLGISRRTVINRLQEFLERSRKFLTRDGVA
ncbi:MAG: RNA polymerase sigma factor [Myxococcaceae bacterium]